MLEHHDEDCDDDDDLDSDLDDDDHDDDRDDDGDDDRGDDRDHDDRGNPGHRDAYHDHDDHDRDDRNVGFRRFPSVSSGIGSRRMIRGFRQAQDAARRKARRPPEPPFEASCKSRPGKPPPFWSRKNQ